MKLFVIAVASAAILSTSGYAQNTRVPEQEAKPGQPTVGQPQTSDPRTTTGKAPIAVPVLGRRMEQKAAPQAIRTPIACRRELRAERADLQARVPDCMAFGGPRTGQTPPMDDEGATTSAARHIYLGGGGRRDGRVGW